MQPVEFARGNANPAAGGDEPAVLSERRLWQLLAEWGKPDPRALVVAFLVVAAQVACIECLLHPDFVHGVPEGYLLTESNDDYTHVALASLKAARSPSWFNVVVLGGSAAREAVFADSEMNRVLTAQLGDPVSFWNLGCNSQSLTESVGLAANAPPGPGTLILIGVSPDRFTRNEDALWKNRRLPFVSSASRAALKEICPTDEPAWLPALIREQPYIGRYFGKGRFPILHTDNVWTALADGPCQMQQIHYQDHVYTDEQPGLSEAARQRLMHELKTRRIPESRKHHDGALACLRALVEQARRKG